MKKDNPYVAGRPFMYDARRHRAIAALRIEPRVFCVTLSDTPLHRPSQRVPRDEGASTSVLFSTGKDLY